MVRKSMKTFSRCLIIAACVFVALSCSSRAAENRDFQIRKQPEIQQIKPKKPVKIKVKRLSEGTYTWELSGDHVSEIVRTDRTLRRRLDVE